MTNKLLKAKLLTMKDYFLAFLSNPAAATFTVTVTQASASGTLTVDPADKTTLFTGSLDAHFDEVFNELVRFHGRPRSADGVSIQ